MDTIGFVISIVVGIVGFIATVVSIIAYFENKRKETKLLADEKRQLSDKAATNNQVSLSLPRMNYFFGRTEEIERINKTISPDIEGWGVLIEGPGGIGKTALALHTGHSASNQDFPLKIFLSAQNHKLTSDGVQTLSDFVIPDYITLLTELGKELGDKGIEKLAPNQRARSIYETLKEKKALIIIDGLENFDIEEENRLFEFLKRLPNTCKAIVTTRRRGSNFTNIMRLDRLSFNATEKLIDRLAENHSLLARSTSTERQKLYEVTGGNPLLIEWISGQLGRPDSRCRTLEDAFRLLESASSGEDALRFVFSDQLTTLVDAEITVLAVLTYFAHPIPAEWLTQLTKLSKPTIELSLEHLAERTMIVTSDQMKSPLILPLVNKFLKHARPDTIEKAGQNLTELALKLLEENGYRQYNRFHILNNFWPIVVASFSVFSKGDSTSMQKVCEALFDFPDFYGYWDDYLNLVLTAESMAVAEGDMINAGRRVYDSGFIYSERGQSGLLEDCIRRAEKYWSEASQREKSYVHRLRAWAFRIKNDYDNTLKEHREFVAIWQTIDPLSYDYIKGLSSLASTERTLEYLSSAQEHYEQVLSLAELAGDVRFIAVSKTALASIALKYGRLNEAETLIREALIILEEKIYKKESLGIAYTRLSKILLAQGRAKEAVSAAQAAVKIQQELGADAVEEAEQNLKECLASYLQSPNN